MLSDKLNEAIQLVKSGNKVAALPILKQIIQVEPTNENAWLWLYACVDDISQKKYCLQKVLEINPNNSNARNAFEKLANPKPVSNFPPPSQQPQNYSLPPQRAFSHQGVQVKKPQKPKGNLWAISIGVVIFGLLCIGGLAIGGNYIYKQYSDSLQQVSISQNGSENPNDNSNITQNNDLSTPSPSEGNSPNIDVATVTPLVMPDSSLDIRITPYLFLRKPAGDLVNNPTGWDDINVAVAVENYSDSMINISNVKRDSFKIKTSDGNEYKCDEFGIGGSKHVGLILAHSRLLYRMHCSIPSPSNNGYIVSISLTVKSSSMIRSESCALDRTQKCPETDILIEFNPEQVNSNLTFPFIKELEPDIDAYASKYNITLVRLNQPLNFMNATLTVNLPPLPAQLPSESGWDGYLFNVNIKSDFLTGDTSTRLDGVMYTPDGFGLLCGDSSGYSTFGPGQSDESGYTCLDGLNLDQTPQTILDSYWFISNYYLSQSEYKEYPQYILVMFK